MLKPSALKPLLTLAIMVTASPAFAQQLPSKVRGKWDVSASACRAAGTSTSEITITANKIITYGGNAIIRTVKRTGPVTYVSADFLQLEGVEKVGKRQRTYFRLTQRGSSDRLNLIWKDVNTVDLVRCGKTAGVTDQGAGRLPIPLGLWVVAGESCKNPSNASWRVYDGDGLFGSQDSGCRINSVSNSDKKYAINQTCVATYDGSKSNYRDTITIQASKRFNLVEGGEDSGQDFNWCGPQLRP